MTSPAVRPLARVSLISLALSLCVVVSAQQRDPQSPVFRSSTTYVSIDVVVTDKNDQPVTDLRQDEFRVVEKNQAQTIADFSFVSIPASYVPVDLDAEPPPASDVASNSLSRSTSRALAIIVDDTRLSPQNIIDVKRALQTVLENLAPDDQVAFTYVRRSDLGRDFTSDHQLLARSVNSLRDAVGLMPLAQLTTPSFDDGEGTGIEGQTPVRLTGLSNPPLFEVLRNVIDTLSVARQSRKAIVLVNTTGCDPNDRNFGDLCKATIKRAKEAGVPIYGLNPLGLTDAMATSGAGAYDSAEGRAGLETAIADDNNSLKILANETGGRAFVQSNLLRAVQTVMSDNGNFYVLGYYPDPVPDDGKFHEVEVTVTRPGLRVRSRPGYTADGGRKRALTIVAEMTKHLGEGLPDPSLPMRAFVAPVSVGRKGTMAIVTAELRYPIPEGGLSGDFSDEWRMGILALDADGKVKASFQRPLTFTGRWKSGASGTFLLNEVVDLPRSTVTVRVGVTSRLLDKTGTVHVAVDVPNFKDKELQLSQILLGAAGTSGPVLDAVLGVDRIRSLVPFQPITDRVFSSGDALRVFSRASWGSKAASLTAELTVVGVPALPGAMGGPFKVLKDKNGQYALLDGTLPLRNLNPGTYVLRIVARLESGETVTRQVPFTIRGAG